MAQDGKIPEVIGLVPAAGDGTRLGALPCSKEVYPVAIQFDEGVGELRVKVAAHYLIEVMQRAGIKKIFVIIKKGKWDIPAYLCDGSRFGVDICYLVMETSPGVPFTLDRAYPFIKNNYIALGFPDILIKARDPYARLLQKLQQTDADVVLGCFPVDNVGKFDMVDLDPGGRIRSLVIKPVKSKLEYSWAIAIWTPKFTNFIHQYLAGENSKKNNMSSKKELYIGQIFNAALKKNLRIEAALYPDSFCVDIGTPADLMKTSYEFRI